MIYCRDKKYFFSREFFRFTGSHLSACTNQKRWFYSRDFIDNFNKSL
jgi:hypothetical protein